MAKKINIDSSELLIEFKTAKNKREQPKGGPKPKKEKAMEQEKKFEEIVESVDAGKRDEPCAPRAAANITMEPRPEPQREAPEEPKPLSLGELRRYLTEFLPAVLNEAQLYIDGAPVTEFYGFTVTSPNGVPTVDLLTRRG